MRDDETIDWRTRLRRVVNREDYLSPWRMALMRLLDPVEWYMRKNDEGNVRPPRRRGRQHVAGSTSYAPLEERPSSPVMRFDRPECVSPAHPGESRQGRARGLESYLQRRDALRDEFASYFEARARELLARREALIETTGGTVRARLVRFRNGAVFEHEYTSSYGSGRGMTRIEKDKLADAAPMIVGHLVQSVLSLGGGAVPLV